MQMSFVPTGVCSEAGALTTLYILCSSYLDTGVCMLKLLTWTADSNVTI